MAPRAYNNETRLQQQEALRQRIAAATAELHAEKGALATSYADIAQRAGVSLPTVYKHFPEQDELLLACTGHVARQAPALPLADILGAPDLESAARHLVDGLDRIHSHFEPWKVWREHRLLPVVGAMYDRQRRDLTALIVQVLARHLGAGDHGELAAVWESLVQFEVWHRLVREHKLSRATVRRSLIQLLLAVAGPQPAVKPSRPKPRKSP